MLEPITNVIDAYERFDRREAGWIKTELRPQAAKQRYPFVGT